MEHALCEYDKYFRFATNDSVRDRTYQSKSGQNKDITNDDLRKCLLCHINFQKIFHKSAMDDDKSYLCHVCLEIETAWTNEDTQIQEED